MSERDPSFVSFVSFCKLSPCREKPRPGAEKLHELDELHQLNALNELHEEGPVNAAA